MTTGQWVSKSSEKGKDQNKVIGSLLGNLSHKNAFGMNL